LVKGPLEKIRPYYPRKVHFILETIRRITQKEFAKKLGISAANLCDIEKGRKGVSIFRATEIAKKIGYSPTVLVELALQEQIDSSGLDFSVVVKKRAA
jgi:transcriptional regulator with XRE-family HTH domain